MSPSVCVRNEKSSSVTVLSGVTCVHFFNIYLKKLQYGDINNDKTKKQNKRKQNWETVEIFNDESFIEKRHNG